MAAKQSVGRDGLYHLGVHGAGGGAAGRAPFGVALGLPYWAAYLSAVVGTSCPPPFIVVYIRRIFQWTRRRLPRLDHLVDRLEAKAHLKGRKVTKYKYLGLMLFVAMPPARHRSLTGALAAAFLGYAAAERPCPSIFAGVLNRRVPHPWALTCGFTSLF